MMAARRPPDNVLMECYARAKGDLTVFLRELNERSWKPESLRQVREWFDEAQDVQTWGWGSSTHSDGDPDDAA